eukprot:CAMPEP_0116549148 /NCGR_PEP_ID=MMETSP0397-20121206/4720_1 /TAXON_ID=216820 /ORGANISM="Cyclophora tenuis, Strain ECT3854" /LENGTH=49 /DNA_ID=CAMNT_0004073855 /DNA_START=64 /DNA_END=213 /DNA_ORIENTATION=+
MECDGLNDRKDMAAISILEANGYKMIEKEDKGCFFVNRDFHNIYNAVAY